MKFQKTSALMIVSTVLMCAALSAQGDEKDRKDRRKAIAAGAIREDVAKKKANDDYDQCMREAAGADDERDCKNGLSKADREANKKARRTAIIVGSDKK